MSRRQAKSGTVSRRLLDWLRRLLGGRAGGDYLNRLDVVMYTRRGCHLCEEAWRQLEEARRRYGFRLSAVDVDGDEALRREHGLHVPVVAVGGKVRFRGRVNAVLLRRLLEAERERTRRDVRG